MSLPHDIHAELKVHCSIPTFSAFPFGRRMQHTGTRAHTIGVKLAPIRDNYMLPEKRMTLRQTQTNRAAMLRIQK